MAQISIIHSFLANMNCSIHSIGFVYHFEKALDREAVREYCKAREI